MNLKEGIKKLALTCVLSLVVAHIIICSRWSGSSFDSFGEIVRGYVILGGLCFLAVWAIYSIVLFITKGICHPGPKGLKINRKQRIILWIGIATISLMLLLPPFIMLISPHDHGVSYCHHGYIITTYGYGSGIDFGYILLRFIVVSIPTAGLMYACNDKRPKINRNRKITLWATIITIGLMVAFPPWAEKYRTVELQVRYSFICMPPSEKSAIDFSLLHFQCTLIALAGIGLAGVLRDKKAKENI